MSDFSVDVAGLAALGTNLDRGRELMGSALGAVRDVGAAPLGTADLDRACSDFQASWSYGLGKLSECIDAVHGGVSATAEAYAAAERALSEGFARVRDALGPE